MNIKEIKPTTGAQVTIVYWPGKCSVIVRNAKNFNE